MIRKKCNNYIGLLRNTKDKAIEVLHLQRKHFKKSEGTGSKVKLLVDYHTEHSFPGNIIDIQ